MSGTLRAGVRNLLRYPWFALLIGWFALRALLRHAADPLGAYDEGLLLSDAYLMNQGRVIYRDFYANYPPGVFQIIRAVLALGLPGIWTVRLLGLLVRIATALCAARLAHHAAGRRGFCAWTASAVLVLQSDLGLVFFAYPLALLCGMAAVLVWPVAGERWRSIASGLLLGLLSYVRHDLFIYLMVALCGLEVASWLHRRRPFLLDSPAELGRLAAAMAISVLVLWVPVLLTSGARQTLHDLVIDQARRVMPGRSLPLPSLFEMQYVPLLQLELPTVLVGRTPKGIVLLLLGACAGAQRIAQSIRAGQPDAFRPPRLLTLITILTIATLPQALGRVDYPHVIYCVPVAIAALLASAKPWITWPLLLICLVPWLGHPPKFASMDVIAHAWTDRDDSHFVTPSRQAVADLVRSETRPGETVFLGCRSHQRTITSPVDVLYLTQRRNATRYVQFDPGTVTTARGQAEMIADLKRARPRLAVLQPYCEGVESNASRFPGATLLDTYLREHYAHWRDVGDMEVWVAIGDAAEPLEHRTD